jgi:threonine/homoserine/homoserine lactone efflux protein
MTFGLLLAASLSGAAVKLAPGPAFLALLGIGASRGRRAGALFMCGHFAGDIVWASLSLTAIIGAHTIGTLFFDVLGLASGVYLCWLGVRSATAGTGPDGTLNTETRRPWLRGMVFGLSNPKAYPVAVAMFTATLAHYSGALNWSGFVPLLAAACVGVIAADAVLIAVIGAGAVRRFYRRHSRGITRLSGLLFLGLGAHAIATAAQGFGGAYNMPGLSPRR